MGVRNWGIRRVEFLFTVLMLQVLGSRLGCRIGLVFSNRLRSSKMTVDADTEPWFRVDSSLSSAIFNS